MKIKLAAHAALATALLALPLAADGLDKRQVAPDARWVVHLDVQAIVGSTLFKMALAAAEAENEVDWGDLDELRREFGIDPFKDALSVTLWGTGKSERQAVVLVETTSAIDALLPRLTEVPGYRPVQVGAYAVHSFDGEGHGERAFGYVHERTGSGRRTIVLAHDKDMLVRGIDVVLGHAPNLAQATNPGLRVTPEPGSFVLVAADRIHELAHMDPTSQVARLARSLVLEVGEDRETVFARLAIEAEDAEKARQLTDVLRGAMALATLFTANENVPPGLADLVHAVRFDANGTVVRADFRYNARDLIEDLKELERYEDR